MFDDLTIVHWSMLFVIVAYLLIGLFVALHRMGKGGNSSDSGNLLHFILEILLWPAAHLIDPR